MEAIFPTPCQEKNPSWDNQKCGGNIDGKGKIRAIKTPETQKKGEHKGKDNQENVEEDEEEFLENEWFVHSQEEKYRYYSVSLASAETSLFILIEYNLYMSFFMKPKTENTIVFFGTKKAFLYRDLFQILFSFGQKILWHLFHNRLLVPFSRSNLFFVYSAGFSCFLHAFLAAECQVQPAPSPILVFLLLPDGVLSERDSKALSIFFRDIYKSVA